VSHDRAFLDNVVTSSLVFEGNGRISPYVGGYKDWLRQRPKEALSKASAKNTKIELVDTKVAQPAKKKLSYKLQLELDKLPELMEQADKDVEELQLQASAADFYQKEHQFVADTLAKLEQAEKLVETLMDRWVELEG